MTSLEVQRLGLHREGTIALAGVDLTADRGEIVAVIGPNGAGKTTLFDCISGFAEATEGLVLLDGVDVSSCTPDERSRRGLARTFQRSSVFVSMTVEANLVVGAENRKGGDTLRRFFGLPARDAASAHRVVDAVAQRLGLESIRSEVCAGLPTGMLRLVELGRALCTEPTVLLLDEPASGLDDAETEHLRLTLVELAAEGLAIVVVDHDLPLVRACADEVYALAGGRVIANGPAHEVLDRPDVRAVVLGNV